MNRQPYGPPATRDDARETLSRLYSNIITAVELFELDKLDEAFDVLNQQPTLVASFKQQSVEIRNPVVDMEAFILNQIPDDGKFHSIRNPLGDQRINHNYHNGKVWVRDPQYDTWEFLGRLQDEGRLVKDGRAHNSYRRPRPGERVKVS